MQQKILTAEHPDWTKYIDTLAYFLKAHTVASNPTCETHDLELTNTYLELMGVEIDVEKSMEYIKAKFGECDCEVLKNANQTTMPVFTEPDQAGMTIKEFISEAVAAFIGEDDEKMLSTGLPMGLALNAICGKCGQFAMIIDIRITPHILESKYRCFDCQIDWHLEYNSRIGMGSLHSDSLSEKS